MLLTLQGLLWQGDCDQEHSSLVYDNCKCILAIFPVTLNNLCFGTLSVPQEEWEYCSDYMGAHQFSRVARCSWRWGSCLRHTDSIHRTNKSSKIDLANRVHLLSNLSVGFLSLVHGGRSRESGSERQLFLRLQPPIGLRHPVDIRRRPLLAHFGRKGIHRPHSDLRLGCGARRHHLHPAL